MDEIPTWATDIAAQIWCQPENEDTEMDINLCTSFARALVAERERAATIAMQKPPHLNYCDCGNTDREELQNEIAAAIRKGE